MPWVVLIFICQVLEFSIYIYDPLLFVESWNWLGTWGNERGAMVDLDMEAVRECWSKPATGPVQVPRGSGCNTQHCMTSTPQHHRG